MGLRDLSLRSLRRAAERGRELAGSLVDLALPPCCLLCLDPLGPRGGGGLCPSCLAGLPLLVDCPCPGCGKTATEGPLSFCSRCVGRYLRDGLLAAAAFDGPVRRLVHRLKYEGDLPAGRVLAGLLAAAVLPRLEGAVDVVVPVPLHRRRLRARGFNQAAVLGGAVSRAAGLALLPRALARGADTRPLSGLTRRERRRELRGAFAVRSPGEVRGMRVLLVDDVVTTGATAEECCRALGAAGAASVVAAAAGRALPRRALSR